MGAGEVCGMATTANRVEVPIEVYLTTSYRPDRDWIDGEVRERNMGEGPHAAVQGFLVFWLTGKRREWGIRVLPEQRVQTSETHYRIPDICVARQEAPFERVVRTAPLLCIEVMSWEDRMSEVMERVEDYLGMGVRTVWIVDPRRRRVFSADEEGGVQQVEGELVVMGTEIAVAVAAIFAELDELEGR